MRIRTLAIAIVVCLLLGLTVSVLAAPPFLEGPEPPSTLDPPQRIPAPGARSIRPIDQPNMKDYLRNRERQRLLEAGKIAEAESLALTQDERVLVILVEYAGTDVFTWNPGDEWDPYGITDMKGELGQAVYDEDGNPILGDCSNIITETKTFTYTGPLHNEIPRPLSEADISGTSIWTEDFSQGWFQAFMWGDGVIFDYEREDGSHVYRDFSGKSVKDYFVDASGGAYQITGDVVGWVQLPHSTWYYAADECPGARSVPDGNPGLDGGAIPGAGGYAQLVRDTLDAVNAISDTIPGFDWANYDLDGDGEIDRLWLVHAGYGEEDSDILLDRTDYSESAMWSHSGSVSPPYEVAEGIGANAYIIMPENGGMAVFAHEAGHNLGADDLYAYGFGNTSAGFWTLMADSWTGDPIGFELPALDPWHLENWGWLDAYVISDTSQVYTVTLGQASGFPGGDDVYRGVKIELEDGELGLVAPVWQGEYYWWGGAENVANASMTTADPIAIPSEATAATLSFDLAYDIEAEWDFLWIQVSEDGENWDTLTNENTQCEHDPNWIGALYGFPDDLCGAGLGGFYGHNEDFPASGVEEFDLSAYAGKSIYLRFWYMTDWATLEFGAFVDQVKVMADSATLFSDDAEGGDANWTYEAPWERTNGVRSFTHNYYLQWRNVNENGGYDSALGQEAWRFGPANTGLLVWYNNNFYINNEIDTYLEDAYGYGPKGRMLVIDSHPEPYRDPNLTPSWLGAENTNIATRALVRDAPFTLRDTVPFTMYTKDRFIVEDTAFEGRPAVSSFHDSMGYYPGVASEGNGTYWNTVDWDASAAVPARGPYSIRAASDYPGYHIQYIGDLRDPVGWRGFWGWWPPGTGNPGDDHVQYGWHVELLEEAADHTWATVRIWNSMKELDSTFTADPTEATRGDELTYTYSIKQNIGSEVDAFIAIPLPDTVEYVPDSTFGGAALMPEGLTGSQLAEIYAQGGQAALMELAAGAEDGAGTIIWTGHLGTGEGAPDFGFKVKVDMYTGDLDMAATLYDDGVEFQSTPADTVMVETETKIYLPLVFKNYLPYDIFWLTILHNNDGESQVINAGSGLEDFGGAARFKAVVDQLKSEAINGLWTQSVVKRGVVMISSGDNFLAGPEFNAGLESGVPFYDTIAMELIGYDAVNLGNHDFDFGPDVLADFIDGYTSPPPYVSANLDFSGEPRLQAYVDAGVIVPAAIVVEQGELIGVIGLETPNLPFISSPRNVVVSDDLVNIVQGQVDMLEAKDVKMIILASHLQSIENDIELVGQLDGVDVIIAGGGDELLANPGDLLIPGDEGLVYGAYPLMATDIDGTEVPVVTTSGEYRYVGKLVVGFDKNGDVFAIEEERSGPVRVATGTCNDTLPCDDTVEPDPMMQEEVVDPVEAALAELAATVIGTSQVDLDGRRSPGVRTMETNEGNLIADALKWHAEQVAAAYGVPVPDVALQNGGGIRNNTIIPAGEITLLDTFGMVPFPNFVSMVSGIPRAQFKEILENAVSRVEFNDGRFAQISGFSFVWNSAGTPQVLDADGNVVTPGTRVVDVTLDDGTIIVSEGAVVGGPALNIATIDFLARGGDQYPYRGAPFTNLGATYQQALAHYIESGLSGLISAADYPEGGEGRIIRLDKLITILHTNDTHGTWPETYYYGTPEGFAFLASHIKAERAKNPNTILLDAGDTFQGNAFAQYFRNATPNPIAGGMNLLGYDAFTIGNHEFNFGPTTFATMLGQLDASILGTINLDDNGSYGFINDNVHDYITMTVDGVDIAIMGLTNPRIYRYELPTNIPGLTFYSGLTTGFAAVPAILAAEEPDVLIALTHMGYAPYRDEIDSDVLLAEGVAGIDVIVGGHSHTFLDPAVMVTSVPTNPEGTLIAQTGRYALNLGKVNIGLVGDGAGGYDVVLREGYLLPAGDVSTDPDMVSYLAPFEAELDAYTSTEIGQTTAPIDATEAYTRETTGANLQVDAAVFELVDNGIGIDFYLSGAMSNRAVAATATVTDPVTLTVGDMYTLMPYENSLVVMEMNGPQLKTVLERAYRNYWYYKYQPKDAGSYYTTCMLDINAGGLITYTGDSATPPNGNNVAGLSFNNGAVVVDFADATTYYNVGTVNYLAAGSCNFNDAGVTLWPLGQITADTQFYVRDAVIDYITAMGTVSPAIEGRLVLP